VVIDLLPTVVLNDPMMRYFHLFSYRARVANNLYSIKFWAKRHAVSRKFESETCNAESSGGSCRRIATFKHNYQAKLTNEVYLTDSTMYDTTDTPSKMEESPSIAREENAPVSSSKCPERLVDLSRTSVRNKNVIWVDIIIAVNEELMAVIPLKVCKMLSVFEKGVADLNFEGQVGFICVGKNECNEPTSCVAVTALHKYRRNQGQS
jgi:hypothetical protein